MACSGLANSRQGVQPANKGGGRLKHQAAHGGAQCLSRQRSCVAATGPTYRLEGNRGSARQHGGRHPTYSRPLQSASSPFRTMCSTCLAICSSVKGGRYENVSKDCNQDIRGVRLSPGGLSEPLGAPQPLGNRALTQPTPADQISAR